MLRLGHRATLRRFVHAVAAMALGTGMLAGATAITVLSSASPAAAKTQSADCSIDGIFNQMQGPALVPFMLKGGAAITPGTTQFSVSCTGLPDSATILVGIASPLAGFLDLSMSSTAALYFFMNSGPDFATSTATGTLSYTYTAPDSGALNPDAVCPPSAAQVAMGLSNCAMAIADMSGNEYGFGYVTYPSQNPWPTTTHVATGNGSEFGLTNPPTISVTPSSVQLGATVTLNGTGFWADPDGSLTEPLTVTVTDSAGTEALLSNTGQGTPTSPQPSSGSPVPCTGCAIAPADYLTNKAGTTGGGTLTGGVLSGLTETVPTNGVAAGTNQYADLSNPEDYTTALVPGTLTFAVAEPSVAPFNDGTYDTVTITCTTTCPSPGPVSGGGNGTDPSPVGAIGTATNTLAASTVPGAPTIGTASAGNTQATVRFTAPASNGGSAITGYTATATDSTTPANGGQTASGASSPITVTGLTNGDSYTFTVVATNALGDSAPSAASNAVIPSTNPCAAYTGNDNEVFLCWAYEDLINRAPDSDGLAYWDAQLTAGASRSAVVYDIAVSSEYRTDLVNGYYWYDLGRASDSDGLAYWLAQLAGGTSDESVLAAIFGSDEFYTYSGGTADGFVTALYTDLLGRASDSDGLTYWENQLSSGMSRTAVAASFLFSTEYRTDLVNGYYEFFLGRAPDSDGLAYWVAQLARGGSDESVISGIVGSDEYFTDVTTVD